ncbi:hypothetical protein AAVH_12410 [Aphelenchoides avenae]|nr:hypothetical protein AAVH_12410 [Aphelenchus avenae]
MERKELVQLKEDVAGGNHEKDQQSKSEQTEDNTAADGKIQVVPEENPEDKDASKCNEEALFLDRDALELIFRYALTNESAKRSAGTLIKRLFALCDTFARDAIVRVVKRFSKVRFGCGLITLAKDKDILRFDTFDIGSNDNGGCAGLVKVPDLFQLRELKYSALETWSRKDQYPPTLGFALALIKNNVDTLKVLNGVPFWHLKEPLPALRLDRFVYQIGRNAPLSQDMGNLAQCTIKKFEYCFKTLYGNTNEATEKAIELGFTPELTNGTTIFKRRVEVATGRIVTAVCFLT